MSKNASIRSIALVIMLCTGAFSNPGNCRDAEDIFPPVRFSPDAKQHWEIRHVQNQREFLRGVRFWSETQSWQFQHTDDQSRLNYEVSAQGPLSMDIGLPYALPVTPLWLQGYLDSQFTEAAETLLYEANPEAALDVLSKLTNESGIGPLSINGESNQDYAHRVAAQSHYLKGLCLQALGRFEESKIEYLLVQKVAFDKLLIEKARVGQSQSEKEERIISAEQIQFPGSSSTVAPVDDY